MSMDSTLGTGGTFFHGHGWMSMDVHGVHGLFMPVSLIAYLMAMRSLGHPWTPLDFLPMSTGEVGYSCGSCILPVAVDIAPHRASTRSVPVH